MKIALLGNSHLACVKAAWRSDMHEATFLGATNGRGGLMGAWRRRDDPPALTLVNGAHPTQQLLWRMCCGDAPDFQLNRFDAFVFVGLLEGAQPWHLNNCPVNGDIQGLKDRGIAPRSFAQWRAMYGARYDAEVQRWLVEQVRTVERPDTPMLSVTSPGPRADVAEYIARYEAPARWRALPEALKVELIRNERALLGRLGDELAVQVVHPPLATLIDGHLCPVRYSKGALGSRNLGGGEPQYGDDPRFHPLNITHKNRAYGAIIVEQIHRCLDGRSPDLEHPDR
jgi:hypothetical protein